MTRTQMMNAIAATLKAGEKVEIRVTNARGRTLVHQYTVTNNEIIYTGQLWNGHGNLRDNYRLRVLGRTH